jgi:hypothetical protein
MVGSTPAEDAVSTVVLVVFPQDHDYLNGSIVYSDEFQSFFCLKCPQKSDNIERDRRLSKSAKSVSKHFSLQHRSLFPSRVANPRQIVEIACNKVVEELSLLASSSTTKSGADQYLHRKRHHPLPFLDTWEGYHSTRCSEQTPPCFFVAGTLKHVRKHLWNDHNICPGVGGEIGMIEKCLCQNLQRQKRRCIMLEPGSLPADPIAPSSLVNNHFTRSTTDSSEIGSSRIDQTILAARRQHFDSRCSRSMLVNQLSCSLLCNDKMSVKFFKCGTPTIDCRISSTTSVRDWYCHMWVAHSSVSQGYGNHLLFQRYGAMSGSHREDHCESDRTREDVYPTMFKQLPEQHQGSPSGREPYR